MPQPAIDLLLDHWTPTAAAGWEKGWTTTMAPLPFSHALSRSCSSLGPSLYPFWPDQRAWLPLPHRPKTRAIDRKMLFLRGRREKRKEITKRTDDARKTSFAHAGWPLMIHFPLPIQPFPALSSPVLLYSVLLAVTSCAQDLPDEFFARSAHPHSHCPPPHLLSSCFSLIFAQRPCVRLCLGEISVCGCDGGSSR